MVFTMKRIAALTLTAVLCFGALTACSAAKDTTPCAPRWKMRNKIKKSLYGGVDNPSAFLYNNTCILAAATVERCPSGLWNWS